MANNEAWLLCPTCGNKTRVKIRGDTILENFPLFCSKCKQKTLINVKQLNMSVIKEPDAKTQKKTADERRKKFEKPIDCSLGG